MGEDMKLVEEKNINFYNSLKNILVPTEGKHMYTVWPNDSTRVGIFKKVNNNMDKEPCIRCSWKFYSQQF